MLCWLNVIGYFCHVFVLHDPNQSFLFFRIKIIVFFLLLFIQYPNCDLRHKIKTWQMGVSTLYQSGALQWSMSLQKHAVISGFQTPVVTLESKIASTLVDGLNLGNGFSTGLKTNPNCLRMEFYINWCVKYFKVCMQKKIVKVLPIQ